MGSDDNAEDQDEDLPLTNIGRVWFNLEYDAGSEKLIVNVDRVRNLPGRQQRTSLALSSSSSSSSCDPFLRLYLLPDEKRYLQSKMKRKTRSPTFKETFMFTMSYNLLVERTLRITVFDVDRFMRQTVIGHVLFPLEHLDITRAVALWRDVERSSQVCDVFFLRRTRFQIGHCLARSINSGMCIRRMRQQLKIGTLDRNEPIQRSFDMLFHTYYWWSFLTFLSKYDKNVIKMFKWNCRICFS